MRDQKSFIEFAEPPTLLTQSAISDMALNQEELMKQKDDPADIIQEEVNPPGPCQMPTYSDVVCSDAQPNKVSVAEVPPVNIDQLLNRSNDKNWAQNILRFGQFQKQPPRQVHQLEPKVGAIMEKAMDQINRAESQITQM